MHKKGPHKKTHNKNKDAIEFVLSNRELDDPNINNPNAPSKVLLQVNKPEDLTEKQKEIINQIPKECRGVFDDEAKLKKLLATEAMKKMSDTDLTESALSNQISFDKKVKFDTNVPDVLYFNQKEKITQGDNPLKTTPMNMKDGIEDDKYIDEIFKRAKVTAKIVEYNEFGLEKDIDPDVLEFVTNKQFNEEVDIFIPAPKVNELEFNKFHTDLKPEDMNDDLREIDAELLSDSDVEGNVVSKVDNKAQSKDNVDDDDKDEMIDTRPKAIRDKERLEKEKKKENELEDDFILLANEGQLPVEFTDEKDSKKEGEDQAKERSSLPIKEQGKGPAYKYITKEELDIINKKFNKESESVKKPAAKPTKKSIKDEFNEAVEEMLQSKKNYKTGKKVYGLTKKLEDEGDYEEYEVPDDEDHKPFSKSNDKDNKKAEDDEEYEEYDDDEEYEEYDYEEMEMEEEEDEDEDIEDTKPKSKPLNDPNNPKPESININGNIIKIEYMDKSKEPDPFSKEPKVPQSKQNKKNKKTKKNKRKTSNESYDEEEEYEDDDGKKHDEDEIYTLKDLEKLTTDKDIIAKTIELFEHNEMNEAMQHDQKKLDKELDSKFIHEPKRRKDITTAQAKMVNLPKTISTTNPPKEKRKATKEEINPSKDNDINPVLKHNDNIDTETKEEKKLRKQLVKMEKREKRKENKKVKNAFKEEKKIQSHQIAEANKVFHYGLSVKDI